MILAHAFGQRYDLPIPLKLFVVGGAVVVLVSFLLVERRNVRAGEPVATSDLRRDPPLDKRAHALGVLSLVVLAFLIWCGFAGSQEVAENIVPTSFWLVVWIVVPLSCGLLGDWTRPVNPFLYVARLADARGARARVLGGPDTVAWPRWLSWWPAVVLFFLSASGELVFNVHATLPRNTATALVAYTCVSAAGGLAFGESWRRRGEVFAVLYDTWGRLGWRRFGAPGRPGFGGGLDAAFDDAPARVAFVLLLLISVNFDGLLATPSWDRLEQRLGWTGSQGHLEAMRTLTFVVLAVVVALVFGAFALGAARAGRHGAGPRHALAELLPSLLPIAFGYLLAHNLQYVLVNGQLLGPLIGNPVGRDWWPLHLPTPFNDSFEPHPAFLPSAFYWYASVVVIVAVHVVAVVVAHRHLAARGIDPGAARRSEYPWLVAMVAYTMLSLWLLAQPLVQESHTTPNEAHPPVTVSGSARA